MARSLYGGTIADYTPAAGSVTVYNSRALTTAVTDLAAVNLDGSVGAGQTQVLVDAQLFFTFYGPDGYTGSLWAPKAYQPNGLPDPTAGALRLEPDPSTTFTLNATSSTPDGYALIAQGGVTAYRAIPGTGTGSVSIGDL